MRVLVICGQGMSTSLLVQNMYRYADEGDVIQAASAGELQDLIDQFDIVLLGPQIRYKLKSILNITNRYQVGVAMIDAVAYGHLDGKIAYEQSRALFKAQA